MRFIFAAAAIVIAAPAAAQDVNRMATEAFAAASDGDVQQIAAFIDAGLPVNYERNGRSMLSAAVTSKRIDAVRYLLERGADPMITSYTQYVVGYDTPRPLIEYARKLGAPDIVALLEARLPKTHAAVSPLKNPTPPLAAAQQSKVAPAQAGRISAHWARPAAFAPGQEVMISTSGGLNWRPGKILKIGSGDLDRKYLVVDENGQNDWVSWTQVTTPERQPYWTSYFVGDWSLHTGMSAVDRTDGRDVYRVVERGMKLPPLRVSADGTYSWTTLDGKRLKGKWVAREGVPGITLLRGDKALDWTLYNSTSVPTVDILKADEVRLHNPSVMGSMGLRVSR